MSRSYTLLDYTGFEEYLIDSNVYCNGYAYTFKFDNEYGASVIKHDYSYGGTYDLFELAVLNKYGKIIYDTEITDDVIGDLTNEEVLILLERIKQL